MIQRMGAEHKAVIYRNVDRKAWEQIAKEHQGVRTVVVAR